MPAGFHDVLFPKSISLDAKGGPVVDGVDIMTLYSGQEQRNIANELQTMEWVVNREVLNSTEIASAIQFLRARNGPAYSFRFFDYSDYQVVTGVIGTATAGQTDFQLVKIYSDSAGSYTRNLTKPIDPNTYSGYTTPKVYIDGVEQASGWSIDYSTGVLSFTSGLTAGEVVTATFDFHCHVRFDFEKMSMNLPLPNYFDWVDIIVVEEKESSNV